MLRHRHSFLSCTPSTKVMRWVCSRQRDLRSIIHSYVPEQVGHGLVILDTPDCLRQHDADVHSFNFVTLHFLDLVWDCVSYNYLKEKVDNLRYRNVNEFDYQFNHMSNVQQFIIKYMYYGVYHTCACVLTLQ